MADACSHLWHLFDSQLLTHFYLLYPHSLPWKICQLRKPMHCALISARSTNTSRPELRHTVPKPWTSIDHNGMISAWTTMSTPKILPPCSKSLVKGIEMAVCPPPPRHNPIKARTVEDGIRAVVQAFTQLGAPCPRKDAHGSIDFRIQHQIKAYKKDDAPPNRLKPVPIIFIIIFIIAQAFGDTCSEEEMAIVDIIMITFFYLLWPGQYTGTVLDDAAFKLQDAGLCNIC
jgi:hypothetical protein